MMPRYFQVTTNFMEKSSIFTPTDSPKSMKVKAFGILITLYFIFIAASTMAQETVNSQKLLVEKMVKAGFENVGIYQHKNDIYLFYENRLYRWEIEGLSKLIQSAVSELSDSTRLHVIPLYNQIPVAVVTTGIQDYKKMISGENANHPLANSISVILNSDSVRAIQKSLSLQNSPSRKLDLIFLPGLRFQYGNLSNPWEKRISISPILQTSLWKGNLLSAEVLIPLYNDLQQHYEGDIRLETATLNQLFRLPKNLFIYTSAGIFSYTARLTSSINYKRYGVSTEVRKYLLNGRICAGGNIGLTGYLDYVGGTLNYWPLDQVNFALYTEYREPTFDLATRLTVGKFLYNDYAVRLDLKRRFHESTFGVFILKSNYKASPSETGTVGGISLTLPISSRKATKPAPFRMKLAKYFDYEYRERTVDPLATTYRTNNDWNETVLNLNPDYIKKQLMQP